MRLIIKEAITENLKLNKPREGVYIGIKKKTRTLKSVQTEANVKKLFSFAFVAGCCVLVQSDKQRFHCKEGSGVHENIKQTEKSGEFILYTERKKTTVFI